MGLPELIANSPVPGSVRSIATLSAAVTTTGATTISTSAPAPALLQGTGQFRIVIDSEIMLVTGGASTTTWTVARKQEGSTAATHLSGAQIFHDLTREGLLNTIIGLAVTSQVKQLGAALTGNITPNVGEARVFKGAMIGNCAIQAPTGLPGVIASTLYWEIELEGEHTITFPGITGWRFGSEPPQQLVVNRYTFFTDDGVHVYGVGSEGLPANTVIVAPGSSGQAILSDGTNWAAGTITFPPSGLTKEQVEAEIAALAMTRAELGSAISLSELIFQLATKRVRSGVTISTTPFSIKEVHRNTWLRCNKASAVLVLETFSSAEDGEAIVIENISSGVIELEGPINGTAVVKVPVQPGEVVRLWGKGTLNEWRIESIMRQWSAISTAIAGPFEALNLSGKAGQAAVGLAHGYRMELNGTTVRLKGSLEVITSAVKAGNTFFTVPTAGHPSVELLGIVIGRKTDGTSVPFSVGTTGTVKLVAGAADLSVGTVISFDGQTFTL